MGADNGVEGRVSGRVEGEIGDGVGDETISEVEGIVGRTWCHTLLQHMHTSLLW